MLEWMTLFPLPLLVLTILLVILPTLAAIMARVALHRFLHTHIEKVSRLLALGESRGLQPKILDDLEARYKTASYQMESVNTGALIDSVYAQERISMPGFSLRCDQTENFCRTLPNLLLAFGLLGTFWGITSNLYGLGQGIQGISQTGADVGALIQQLRPQLQGMGIAFVTSLVALLCSSVLTLTNLYFNTGLAKYRLISCLEDYLDNIFKPTVDGDTRLDRAVNRMVEQQQEFLLRFHERVGQVLEDTFGRAANQISQESTKTNALAQRVYENFANAAGTMAAGAKTFETSAQTLQKQTQIVAELIPHFQFSTESIHQSSIHFCKASEKFEQSKVFENLECLTENLSLTQTAFSQSTEQLQLSLKDIIINNQQATELAEQVYHQLQESSGKIQDGAIGFLEAANTINNSEFANQLADAVSQWSQTQQQFSQSTDSFSQAAQILEPTVVQMLQSSKGMEGLGQRVEALSQKSLALGEATHYAVNEHNQRALQLQQDLVQSIQTIDEQSKQANQQTNKTLHTLTETWTENTNKQLSNYTNHNQQFLTKLDQHLAQSATQNQALEHLGKVMIQLEQERNQIQAGLIGISDTLNRQVSQTTSTLNTLNQTWETTSTKQLKKQDETIEQFLSRMDQHLVYLGNHHETLGYLVNTLIQIEDEKIQPAQPTVSTYSTLERI